MHAYIHTCMHFLHAYIHTYIHACIHTYIPCMLCKIEELIFTQPTLFILCFKIMIL